VDAIEMLKADHAMVKDLFRRFERAGNEALSEKEQIVREAIRDLDVHAALEEQIFYPAVLEKGGELADTVREGMEEHHVAHTLIDELKELSGDDEQFQAKFTVLTESVKHHIEEEESELLPEARERLGASAIDRLSDEMAKLKQQLQRQMAAVRR
jgi:hemerythrin-like domain-containing protein